MSHLAADLRPLTPYAVEYRYEGEVIHFFVSAARMRTLIEQVFTAVRAAPATR